MTTLFKGTENVFSAMYRNYYGWTTKFSRQKVAEVVPSHCMPYFGNDKRPFGKGEGFSQLNYAIICRPCHACLQKMRYENGRVWLLPPGAWGEELLPNKRM
jgi:hypothetical protein